ncbi:hypothetical protein C8R46DRAFT_419343 [Mycena filopes]|nr:hypothetical protein C8R46DRAFT_419343 [Mycena filopes]
MIFAVLSYHSIVRPNANMLSSSSSLVAPVLGRSQIPTRKVADLCARLQRLPRANQMSAAQSPLLPVPPPPPPPCAFSSPPTRFSEQRTLVSIFSIPLPLVLVLTLIHSPFLLRRRHQRGRWSAYEEHTGTRRILSDIRWIDGTRRAGPRPTIPSPRYRLDAVTWPPPLSLATLLLPLGALADEFKWCALSRPA